MASAFVGSMVKANNTTEVLHQEQNHHQNYDNFAKHYNVTEIEQRVMQNMKAEFDKIDVRSKIEAEV